MFDGIRQRVGAIDEAARGWCIGGVRILVGLMWLANLHWKVPPNFGEDTGGGLFKYSASVSRHSTFAPFTWFTEQVVLPNFQAFGWFTLVLETTLAMLLIVGYRTKIVALLGAAMSVPILLSVIYYDRTYEWAWSYLLMIGVHVLLYATDAGKFVGLDGVLDDGVGRTRQTRSLQRIGGLATVIGLAGLFVARSVDFAGDTVRLLGSDAGYVDGESIQRRWELKFLFFNPLWAVLTIVFGVLLIVGARQIYAAYAGAAGFALLSVVIFFVQTFDYDRDLGQGVQVVSTGSNVAVWGAFALAGGLLARRLAAAEGDGSSVSALN